MGIPMKNSIVLSCLVIISLQLNLKAQGTHTQAFDFVTWPHSVSGLGAGQMGVASLTNDDALVYNPAKLSLTTNTRFSFYRNPLQVFIPAPLTSYTLYHNVPGVGSFAINFENQDYGEFIASIIDPDNPQGYTDERAHDYNNSFAAGYARTFSENFSAGIQFRYAYWHFRKIIEEAFLISLGGLYTPDFCERRFTFGFSLMNLGPAVKFELEQLANENHFDPPPTRLNLGVNFTAVENNYFTLPLSLGIWKPFDERNDDGEGQSSFKTIFSDWSDFPNDVSLQTGLSFIWKPLYFSDDFAFFQEFYTGNISTGIKTHLQNFYTHGTNIGLEIHDFKFSAGYAGVAHNVHYPNFLQWTFPYETFQLTFELNDNLLFGKDMPAKYNPKLHGFIISLGLSESVRLNDLQPGNPPFIEYSTKNSLNYSAEVSFYFNEKNALISSFAYSSIPNEIKYTILLLEDMEFTEKSKVESFFFFTSYRYHPIDEFNSFFIQGGLGIFRFNPVIKSSPRYDYKTSVQLTAGLMLDFLNPVILIPALDYNFVLFPSTGDAPRIKGFNQFNPGFKIGYRIF
jgi:hypothetical protein